MVPYSPCICERLKVVNDKLPSTIGDQLIWDAVNSKDRFDVMCACATCDLCHALDKRHLAVVRVCDAHGSWQFMSLEGFFLLRLCCAQRSGYISDSFLRCLPVTLTNERTLLLSAYISGCLGDHYNFLIEFLVSWTYGS